MYKLCIQRKQIYQWLGGGVGGVCVLLLILGVYNIYMVKGKGREKKKGYSGIGITNNELIIDTVGDKFGGRERGIVREKAVNLEKKKRV